MGKKKTKNPTFFDLRELKQGKNTVSKLSWHLLNYVIGFLCAVLSLIPTVLAQC